VSPPQSPWAYTGPFSIAATLSPSFGGVASFTGRSFGILNGSATISQDMTGLVPGQTYFITWLQMKRPNVTTAIGLSVSAAGSVIYDERSVEASAAWIFRSSNVFTAAQSNLGLFFNTSVSGPPSSAIAIDSIKVNIYFNILDA
jgi:hypothetical protein